MSEHLDGVQAEVLIFMPGTTLLIPVDGVNVWRSEGENVGLSKQNRLSAIDLYSLRSLLVWKETSLFFKHLEHWSPFCIGAPINSH